ncbi:hypothetical protein Fmac_000513 [Flemingia macrophylla]|uniref:Uncharacterized protein n=1 Tax=Flemingia macrophylla TaxID=520843 RepID=A0ABD1NEG6_9FABA
MSTTQSYIYDMWHDTHTTPPPSSSSFLHPSTILRRTPTPATNPRRPLIVHAASGSSSARTPTSRAAHLASSSSSFLHPSTILRRTATTATNPRRPLTVRVARGSSSARTPTSRQPTVLPPPPPSSIPPPSSAASPPPPPPPTTGTHDGPCACGPSITDYAWRIIDYVSTHNRLWAHIIDYAAMHNRLCEAWSFPMALLPASYDPSGSHLRYPYATVSFSFLLRFSHLTWEGSTFNLLPMLLCSFFTLCRTSSLEVQSFHGGSLEVAGMLKWR